MPVAVFLTAAIPWSAAESAVVTAEYTAIAGNNDSHVLPAAYSTGQAGHKLKWLPARTSAASQTGRTPSRAKAARYDAPPSVRVAARGTVDPFSDPFGKAGSVSAAGQESPNKQVSDDALNGKALQPPLLQPQSASPSDAKPLEADSIQRSEKVPSLFDNDLLAVKPEDQVYDCDAAKDIKSLSDIYSSTIKLSIAPPESQSLPVSCKLQTGSFEDRRWAPTTFMWKASGLCHKPAYFEQVQLERYGHSTGPYTQPLASAVHFFLSVPVLPYKMGLYPPGECIYTLGYYRPGSCAPYLLDPLPLSIRAGIAQAGVMTGLAALIP